MARTRRFSARLALRILGDPMTTPVVEQVGEAGNLLGLLLALDTLFTSEQSRRLFEERSREGGARGVALQTVLWTSLCLALLTAAAIVFLAPLIVDVVSAVGDAAWEPVLGVFGLTYLLLLGLFCWQIFILIRSLASARGSTTG